MVCNDLCLADVLKYPVYAGLLYSRLVSCRNATHLHLEREQWPGQGESAPQNRTWPLKDSAADGCFCHFKGEMPVLTYCFQPAVWAHDTSEVAIQCKNVSFLLFNVSF